MTVPAFLVLCIASRAERNPTPPRAQNPPSLPLRCLPRKIRSAHCCGSVSQLCNDLVSHPGSRDTTSVQIHKRLGEQPGLVPEFGQLPPVTMSPILLRDALQRPQRQSLMTHPFSKRIQLIAPSHHHGRRGVRPLSSGCHRCRPRHSVGEYNLLTQIQLTVNIETINKTSSNKEQVQLHRN